MFRRRRAKEEAPPAQATTPQPSAPMTDSSGWVVHEIPTYHGLKRRVVVYTKDAQGRVVKRYK